VQCRAFTRKNSSETDSMSCFGKRISIPGISSSKGTLMDLLSRLERVRKGSGGAVAEEMDMTKGLSDFDAYKIIIAKKIRLTRKTIKEAELAHSTRSKVQKKQDCRNMISFIKLDLEMMEKLHDKEIFSGRFKKTDPKLLAVHDEEIMLIKLHVQEIVHLAKRRYERKSLRRNKRGSSTPSRHYEDDSFLELPDDPTETDLPEILIEIALEKVQKNKKELSKGLKAFRERLEAMKAEQLQMADNLDTTKTILADTQRKVDDDAEELRRVKKTIEKL